MANIALSLPERGRSKGDVRRSAESTLRVVPSWRPFIGREDLVEGARQALVSSAGAGILLVGGAGVGKTTLAQHLVEQYFGQACVVQVRGSAATAQLPFGALGFLLAEAPADALDHPVVGLQEASRLLLDRAAGRKLLIMVENAGELDALSAAVLIQLARARLAKLIVSVTGFPEGGDPFARLWSGGELLRLDLENFTLDESGRFVESLLGGPISRAAVRALWGLTAGNPLFLRLLALEQRSAGVLVQREGLWVLAGRMVHLGEIAQVVRSWLETFTPRQRGVLELLAFAAELPLALLHRRGDEDIVDELQELGVLDVSPAGPATVRLKQPLVAAVLRQTVQPGRSLELWQSIAAGGRPENLNPSAVVRFAEWSLDCGQPLDRPTALEAAGLANRLQDRTAALRLARCVADSSRDPELVLEEARALSALGDPLAAVQAVDRVPLPAVGSLVRTRLLLERHRALRSLPESAAASDGVLPGLRRSAERAEPGTVAGDKHAVDRELTLAEAEQAVYCGRLAQLPAALGQVFDDRSLALHERLGAGVLLGAARSLTGRATEAVGIAEQLEAALGAPQLMPAEQAQVRGGIFMIYLAAGLWTRCAQLLEEDLILGGTGRGMGGELAAGLLHTLCGRAEKGREALEGVIAQLEVADPAGVLPLALAAAAYACALGADQARARRYLQACAQAGQPGPWALRAGSDYFRILTQARLGRRDEAVAELNDCADQAAAGGLHTQMAICLGAAARLGDLASARRLAGSTATGDGPLAQMLHLSAAGQIRNEAGLLLRAGELARNEGNDLLAYELAETVARMAPDEAGRRQARLLQRQTFRKLDRFRNTRRRIQELNDFERDLAVAAGQGRSSTSLAKELHLSPRTVDWHLGKIYSRLQVSGRAELREILA
ncbi:LuxR C-terminal-related transcriptional regulator [Arthrobacter sp. I2-34]|uniref:LuxR C-terminal-related transcriptional regulator n=1 Tax=Arthrobacter hankyongi TaxID=2904801 RepID=A0ABS9L1L6_9MICC|nr:LuxR C-terminal-related transcriptional regulator [Arthrobacter hankyongi]MCG2620530.1 LuxR C-terminal-related transcriptional regulator [Arthrobacter hankyongi]